MDMKKIKRFALLLIMASLAVNVQAQLEQAVKKIFAGDTVATHPVSLHRDSDSARVPCFIFLQNGADTLPSNGHR